MYFIKSICGPLYLQIACLAVIASAQIQITKPLQEQDLPVARVNQPWTFVVMPDTFVSPTNSSITLVAQNLPSWATFEASTQTFSGEPGANDIGSTNVRLSASADDQEATSASFDLLVSDEPAPYINLPVASQLPNASSLPSGCILHYDQSLRVPSGWSFSIDFGQNTFADGNGYPIYYSAHSIDDTSLPSWLSFANKSVTFDGVAPQSGVYPIVLAGSTYSGYNDVSQIFTITVSEHQFDLIAPLPPLVGAAGSNVNYTVPITSLEIDHIPATPANITSITVNLSAYPDLQYTPSTRTISGQLPSGEDEILSNITITFMNSYGEMLQSAVAVQLGDSLFATATTPVLQASPGQTIDSSLSSYFADSSASYTVSPPVNWLSYNAANESLHGTVPMALNGNVTVPMSAYSTSGASQTINLILSINNDDVVPQDGMQLSRTTKVALAASLSSLAAIGFLAGLILCFKHKRNHPGQSRRSSNRSVLSRHSSVATPYSVSSTKKQHGRVTVHEVGGEDNASSRPTTRYVHSPSAESLAQTADANQTGAFLKAHSSDTGRRASVASLGLGIHAVGDKDNEFDAIGLSTYRPESRTDAQSTHTFAISDADSSSWGSKASSQFSKDLFYPEHDRRSDDDHSSESVKLESTPKRRREFQHKPVPLDLTAARELGIHSVAQAPRSAGNGRPVLSPRLSKADFIAQPPLSAPAIGTGKSPRSVFRPLSPRPLPVVPFGAPQTMRQGSNVQYAYGSPVVASPRMDSSPLLSAGANDWRNSLSPHMTEDATPSRSRFSVDSVPYTTSQRPDSSVIDYIFR